MERRKTALHSSAKRTTKITKMVQLMNPPPPHWKNTMKKPPKLMSITETDQVLYYAVLLTIPAWLFFLTMVYATAQETEMEYLQGAEQKAAAAGFYIFAVSIALTILPVWIHHRHGSIRSQNPLHYPLHRNHQIHHFLFQHPNESMATKKKKNTKKTNNNNNYYESDNYSIDNLEAPLLPPPPPHFASPSTRRTTNTTMGNSSSSSATSKISVIFLCLLVIETITLITNGLLAFAPVVVKVDPVTHCRVFLVRWCSYIPTAGLMTFLAEGIAFRMDSNRNRYGWAILVPVAIGLGQSFACLCGLLLPYCPNVISWCLMMGLGSAWYGTIFPRVAYKYKAWQAIQRRAPPSGESGSTMNATVSEMEAYHRIQCAYDLLWACAALWTVLVVLYFVNFLGGRFCDEESFCWFLQIGDSFAMVSETGFDVVAKCFYTKAILELYEKVFDSECRAHRLLLELSKLMSTMWETKGDVMVMSVQKNDRFTTVLSPTFATLVGVETDSDRIPSWMALVVVGEIQQHYNGEDSLVNLEVYFVDDTASIPHPIDATMSPATEFQSKTSMDDSQACLVREARKVAQVLFQANKSTDVLLFHDLTRYDTSHISPEVMRYELKLTRDNTPEGATIAIMRNVTKGSEAEQLAHSESLVLQQKDAPSVNRFTSQEVKNGLLTGIELCDYLHSAMEDLKMMERTTTSGVGNDSRDMQNRNSNSTSRSGVSGCVTQLEGTLHGVLDTVLADAMVRDVVQGLYQPRLERVDILQLLMDTTKVRVGSSYNAGGRFKMKLHPPNMPSLSLDPQLIKYIYRNALANACKYGAHDGDVISDARYSTATNEFMLLVINAPGEMHDKLLELDNEASESVFALGTRLHVKNKNKIYDRSPGGDGAWIMQQCAKTMGGHCSIRFEKERTVFSFRCSAQPQCVPWHLASKDFEVPPGTWGVAIEDSLVQQRVLTKIMTHVGVASARMILCGKTLDEVEGVKRIIVDIVATHPTHKVLVLVDENLDYYETHGTRLSGSKLIEEVLGSLESGQEARVLALVRSVDDSTQDVALFRKRTHGFFPKASMTKEQAREILAPIWMDRFSKKSK